MVLKVIGLGALCFMIGSEAFAMSAAFLWPIAFFSHLGVTVEHGVLGFCALIGAAAAVALWRRAQQTAAMEAKATELVA